MSAVRVIGADPNSPGIRRAIAAHDRKGARLAAKVMTDEPQFVLEKKFGIHLRKPSLMQSAMLARIGTVTRKIPAEFQAFVWIWTLAAPLPDIYAALELVDRPKGTAKLTAAVQQWWDEQSIPANALEEVMLAVTETFRLADELLPKEEPTEEGGLDLKKNPPGTSPQRTSSPASTVGAGAPSGGK